MCSWTEEQFLRLIGLFYLLQLIVVCLASMEMLLDLMDSFCMAGLCTLQSVDVSLKWAPQVKPVTSACEL